MYWVTFELLYNHCDKTPWPQQLIEGVFILDFQRVRIQDGRAGSKWLQQKISYQGTIMSSTVDCLILLEAFMVPSGTMKASLGEEVFT